MSKNILEERSARLKPNIPPGFVSSQRNKKNLPESFDGSRKRKSSDDDSKIIKSQKSRTVRTLISNIHLFVLLFLSGDKEGVHVSQSTTK